MLQLKGGRKDGGWEKGREDAGTVRDVTSHWLHRLKDRDR